MPIKFGDDMMVRQVKMIRKLPTQVVDRVLAVTEAATSDPRARDEFLVTLRREVSQLQLMVDELGVPLATLALGWCLHEPLVAAVITGASRPEQVRSNLAAAELELSEELLGRVRGIVEGGA